LNHITRGQGDYCCRHQLEQKGLNAGDWIRSVAEIVGGSGGGRATWRRPAASMPKGSPPPSAPRIKELLA
jgi:hypothetical protein